MKISDKDRERLEKAQKKWASEAHHDGLPKLAGTYKWLGISEQDALDDMQRLYTNQEALDGTTDEHDEHMREVEQAVVLKYEKEDSDSHSHASYAKPKPVDYAADREKWHEENVRDTKLLAEVKRQDVRKDTRIHTGEALQALFSHASGHIWHGATEGVISEYNWMDAGDAEKIPAGENYVCTATFGNMLKSGEEGTVYERTNDNVQQVAFAVLEMDAPMAGQQYSKDEMKALSKEDKRAYRERILRDTCLIVEGIGLRPTTITFSGNKSYHCAFRFSNPVPASEWNSRYNELKGAYRIIGADEAMLSLMRCTRMPLGSRIDEAEQGDCQRLVYFDPEAETDFGEFVDKVAGFASEISKEKEASPDICLPMYKDKKGWHKDCEKRTDFITTARVSKVENGESQRLIVSDERGVFRYKTPQQIADYMVNYVFRHAGKKEGEHFADLYKTELSKASLDWFVGIVRPLNMPRDTVDKVYAPFANGMLVIDKKNAVLKPNDYLGYDVSDTSPTLYRTFVIDKTKSEFETFLERACGSEENHEFWKGRKESLMSLLGYMVCRKKEAVNYINIITEESHDKDSGRTGKGIISTAVKYWRKRRYVDMKNVKTEDQQRWILSSFDVDTDEFIQFDDIRENLDWELFYNRATDDWEIEKKGKDKFTVTKEKAPKMLFTTNYYPKAKGGSQAGRMRIFEISNHYSKNHTPDNEFGHRLFDNWDEEEWNRFDTFIANCVGLYLIKGYIPCPVPNMVLKEYEATVPKYMKNWFEDENGLFSDLSKEHKKIDLEKEYKLWYKNKYGMDDHKNQFPTDDNLKLYVDLYCNAHGLVKTSDKKSGYYWWIFKSSQGEEGHQGVLKDVKNPEVLPVSFSEATENKQVANEEGQKDAISSFLREGKNFNDDNNSTHTHAYIKRGDSTSFCPSQTEDAENKVVIEGGHPQPPSPSRPSCPSDEENIPWWPFNGSLLSFDDEKDDKGNIVKELVYCKGKVPPPIKHGGELCYQIKGSYRKSSGVGVVTDGLPVEFIVID